MANVSSHTAWSHTKEHTLQTRSSRAGTAITPLQTLSLLAAPVTAIAARLIWVLYDEDLTQYIADVAQEPAKADLGAFLVMLSALLLGVGGDRTAINVDVGRGVHPDPDSIVVNIAIPHFEMVASGTQEHCLMEAAP